MEELCPDAWLINYANPMAINCWALNDYTRIKNVGLCHSVQHTSAELARYIGVPFKDEELPEGADPYYHLFQNQIHEELNDLTYWVAGINHMAWFLEFEWRGKDAYPLLREKLQDPVMDIVRAEVLKTFGYFVTESSWHMASYVPYFKKRPDLIVKFKVEDHPVGREVRLAQDEELRQQILTDHNFPIIRSSEYGATIIHSIETGTTSRINANVKNHGLITNLPEGCCVEVPCMVDKEGIHPCYVGDLPPQLAALNRTNISVQELAVKGIVEKDKTAMFHAILLDPLTSAILTIDETRQLVDEMFKEAKEYVKGFK